MKKYSFLLVSIILIFMFGKLTMNYKERYTLDAEAVVLSDCTKDSAAVVKAIIAKNYLPTEEDAAFAVGHLKKIFRSGAGLTSLYDLNKRDWKIPSEQIEKNGTSHYRNLLALEQASMGIDEEFNNLDKEALESSATIDENSSGSITVHVNSVKSNVGLVSKLFNRDSKPCKGVVVRLYEHYIDKDNVPHSRILAHTRTDGSGKAKFKGLDKSCSYSVVPIKKGYEYGAAQGTVAGTLAKSADNGALVCNFVENSHNIKVFSTTDLKNIKSDHTIVVRSLRNYLVTMAKYMGVFFLIWWIFIFLYKRRNQGADMGIISIIMMFTGLCLLMMFSMNDPLNDKIIGVDMAQGVIAGVIVMMFLQFVDFRAFYQGKSRLPFDIPAEVIKCLCWPFGLYRKMDSLFSKLPKGFGYMLVALVMTLLLFTPLGVAVGGMKVNLNVGILFQPSEIAKYLIIIFIAAFFCANADKIVKFSDKGNVDLFGSKMRMLGAILLGLIFLMGLYLLLGDMGPAMVLSFTFIIMYSIIKSKVDLDGLSEKEQLRHILTCDLAMLIYGVLSFVIMLYVGNLLGLMWIFCLAWFALWIIFGLFKKRVFESAIVFNLIIAAFVFGASIMNAIPGLDSVADRLESRNEMCTNTWGTLPLDGAVADAGENPQVAEGLWGLASGGFIGQGIGQGSPSLIPAFHTDMILSSIGEQIGFVGLLVIVILLVILLRKTILQGYQTAHPFTFYICLGIAVVTGVQFIIIALGSTGIIPLTGVTVPFFSFGKVSMILNLAAFGIVLSIAGRNCHKSDVSEEVTQLRKEQMRKYDYSIALTNLAFFVISLFIMGVYLKYQVFQRDDILTRPVYVNNTEGYPVVKYNPRIEQIARKMPIGNIYDRNGILLATSDSESLKDSFDILISRGADSTYLAEHMKMRLRRYYPFGNQLFFMLGDYNTRFMFTANGSRGYFAEHEHLSQLRGYDDRMKKGGEYVKVDLVSDSFKPGKFFDADSNLVAEGVQLRDYKSLLPALKNGEHTGTDPKDIKLTLDVGLQTALQDSIANFINSHIKLKQNNALRVSVVVIDAVKGDLLASAVYPLPDQKRLMSMDADELSIYRDKHRPSDWKAYSDMDLGLRFTTAPGSSAKVLTAIAALQQEGKSVSDTPITIYPEETIHKTGLGIEPGTLEQETIKMNDALRESSNIYFVKLLNQYDLYETIGNLYHDLGCSLDDEIDRESALANYDDYLRSKAKRKLNDNEWAYTWGQGGLKTTPLSMAMGTAIAADGCIPKIRYLVDEKPESKKILEYDEARELRKMLKEAGDISGAGITGGKTGTPEREWIDSNGVFKEHYNDGWFVFFMEGAKLDKHSNRTTTLSIAVRMERGVGSGTAKNMARTQILPILKNRYTK